ncbi:MAG: four helix bundle protein [Desulfobacterales bacterium]|nr:four helix bundle protein [Desulfobacterales bacterium]
MASSIFSFSTPAAFSGFLGVLEAKSEAKNLTGKEPVRRYARRRTAVLSSAQWQPAPFPGFGARQPAHHHHPRSRHPSDHRLPARKRKCRGAPMACARAWRVRAGAHKGPHFAEPVCGEDDGMAKIRTLKRGYRDLRSFQIATIIYDATYWFCERFLEPRTWMSDQMVQAARSGRQNIAEGSRASATSSQTELRLVNVARSSLEELLLDYEDYLRHRRLPQWAPDSARGAARCVGSGRRSV